MQLIMAELELQTNSHLMSQSDVGVPHHTNAAINKC